MDSSYRGLCDSDDFIKNPIYLSNFFKSHKNSSDGVEITLKSQTVIKGEIGMITQSFVIIAHRDANNLDVNTTVNYTDIEYVRFIPK